MNPRAHADALIVGGGPAGSAAAIALAQAGRWVRLLERSKGPRDVVCGGFLGWDALASLARLGIDPIALGARPITRLRLVAGPRTAEAPLPGRAVGLSRRVLDEALLGAARSAGARVERGRTVRSADPGSLTVRLDNGDWVTAEALLLATGKHELRGADRERDPAGDSVGIRTALIPSPALAAELDGVIELHLFDGGYGGLLVQEDGSVNLCLSVARGRLRNAGGIEPLIAELAGELPSLGERIDAGRVLGWSAVSGIPYGWRARDTRPGFYRIGDQAAVIASLAGDGVAIALASGRSAAESLIAGGGASAYQRRFAAAAARPLAIGEALRWAARQRLTRMPMMRLAAAPFLPGLAARLTRIGD